MMKGESVPKSDSHDSHDTVDFAASQAPPFYFPELIFNHCFSSRTGTFTTRKNKQLKIMEIFYLEKVKFQKRETDKTT